MDNKMDFKQKLQYVETNMDEFVLKNMNGYFVESLKVFFDRVECFIDYRLQTHLRDYPDNRKEHVIDFLTLSEPTLGDFIYATFKNFHPCCIETLDIYCNVVQQICRQTLHPP